jgi:hypothetical protein
MGFFKCLAYVAGGVGAVVLAPMTGGGSLALAIGAMGTTTAAGLAIGAGIGATAAAIDNAVTTKNEAYDAGHSHGHAEGVKSGERVAQQKYERKISDLSARLKSYYDADKKLVGMYAIGLAVANTDGEICQEEREELDAFVAGCMAGNLPPHIKEVIDSLSRTPPNLERALTFARDAQLPKQDIDDVIDIVANADGKIAPEEQDFIDRWDLMSRTYDFA